MHVTLWSFPSWSFIVPYQHGFETHQTTCQHLLLFPFLFWSSLSLKLMVGVLHWPHHMDSFMWYTDTIQPISDSPCWSGLTPTSNRQNSHMWPCERHILRDSMLNRVIGWILSWDLWPCHHYQVQQFNSMLEVVGCACPRLPRSLPWAALMLNIVTISLDAYKLQ